MKLEDRIARHRRMAEGYRDAYLRQGVQEGATYEEWTFAQDATYASPYFIGDEILPLRESAVSVATSATMEAKAYSLTFPDWKPVDFTYWPADNGFVMKTRWSGHTKDGTEMGFYSYSFVETNSRAEVTHWETHVNEEYSPFLEFAIGQSGPFHDRSEYMDALSRCLDKAGVSR